MPYENATTTTEVAFSCLAPTSPAKWSRKTQHENARDCTVLVIKDFYGDNGRFEPSSNTPSCEDVWCDILKALDIEDSPLASISFLVALLSLILLVPFVKLLLRTLPIVYSTVQGLFVFGGKWHVGDAIANEILDDLLKKEFNRQQRVKDDKGNRPLKDDKRSVTGIKILDDLGQKIENV
ncbi:hypothetical protein Tco_0362842 [Tanacetum coccineum]